MVSPVATIFLEKIRSNAPTVASRSSPIDLLGTTAGSVAAPGWRAQRDFTRHWTPVHLDLVVDDIEHAVGRAVEAGAVLEHPIRIEVDGRLATLADPFGHAICLVELTERGYDALVATSE